MTWSRATQVERVEAMLLQGPVCGTQFVAAYMPRFGDAIWQLRKTYTIDKRRCRNRAHQHRSSQWEYFIVDDGQLGFDV